MRRFEALTGGDEVGAGRLGVSIGFFFGRGIFGREAFGVSTGVVTGSANTLDGIAGAETRGGVGADLTVLAGVPGRVTLDETGGT
jgi:hypothetical protein